MLLKNLKSLLICGQKYKVVWKHDLLGEDGCKLLGMCDYNKCVIYLEKGMDEHKIPHVLLHEVLHAISSTLDLGLNENKVDVISVEILNLIKANKIDFLKLQNNVL